jgi:hypothetical protein
MAIVLSIVPLTFVCCSIMPSFKASSEPNIDGAIIWVHVYPMESLRLVDVRVTMRNLSKETESNWMLWPYPADLGMSALTMAFACRRRHISLED